MNIVQFAEVAMNKAVTSQEEILKISRNIVLKQGISSFSMRTVASQCGVAVGSIYNYFSSKSDLLSATIESVWEEIFEPFNRISQFTDFVHCVSCMFDIIKNGDERYPGFFTVHSLNFTTEDKDKGKATMENYFSVLECKLMEVLERDKHVKEEAFQTGLSKGKFVEYVFTLLLSILLKKEKDCHSLLEMIKNCIY